MQVHYVEYCQILPELNIEKSFNNLTYQNVYHVFIATYCIPHDNVNICGKGIIQVIGCIQIHKVTEMVVHVHSYKTRQNNYHF